jgi:uncharacterized protein (TIGR00369 family)
MDLPFHLRLNPPAPTLLGREVIAFDLEARTVRLRFFARPEFANRHASVHGGIVSAMLDSATSCALMAILPEDRMSLTKRLESDFLKPAPLGELFGEGRIVELTDREAISEGHLEAPDGTIVAIGRAVLRIRPRP